MILMNFRSSRSLSWAFSCNMIIDRTLRRPRGEGQLSDWSPSRPLAGPKSWALEVGACTHWPRAPAHQGASAELQDGDL